MTRTIVILLDGTSNEIARNRTHMLRLYGCLEKSERQLVYYDPGVGTFGAENAWAYFIRKGYEVWGLATGWGLDHNVKEAYRFLVENYSHGDPENGIGPDRIVLAGFSRGAYTARVLAGFLHANGLIAPENINLLDYAYRAYKRVADGQEDTGDRTLGDNPFAAVRLFKRMLEAPRVTVDVMMLFDTVGSVIEWDRWLPRIRRYAFTGRNPSVKAVRHAVAIDDRRTMFQPVHWPMDGEFWGTAEERPGDAQPQNVDEVWFSGVHGDIGGGYAEARSALGKIPLTWMIEETDPLGVLYEEETVRRIVQGGKGGYERPDPLARRNVSMTWLWALVELLPRRRKDAFGRPDGGLLGFYLPMGRYRQIRPGSRIHGSVFERRGTEHDYDQPNIPSDHVKV